MMAEGAKQDVHWWKETMLFYLIIGCTSRANLVMACKEKYNLCMNRAPLDRESLDCVS